MNSLMNLTALEMAAKVRAGELSAQALLDAALAQIKAVDGSPGRLDQNTLQPEEEKKVHAFISLTEGIGRVQAKAVDAAVAAGKNPGLLAGVPVSIKDIFCMQGSVTTAASRMLANFQAPYTATAVQRLSDAGAVIVGKVNLDEFTYGSSSESSAFQPHPYNPWNTEHVTGGSSGGSAAAVAAKETPLSLGSDTSGSIRQPAAFCGVVGLKPSYGRVSRYGLIAFASSLDCPGPMAGNVTDAALMLQVLAGADPKDSTSSTIPVQDYLAALKEGLRGMRIGLSRDFEQIAYPDLETGETHFEPLQPEIIQAVYAAAEVLARAGAEIVENVPLPNLRHAIPAYFVISRVEASSNLHRFDGVKYGYRTAKPFEDLNTLYRHTRGEAFGLQPKLRILMGTYVSAAAHASAYLQRAQKVRALIRSDFDRIFDPQGPYRLDTLLTPTTATTAFKHKAVFGNSVLMQYADQMVAPVNHAGLPAISIPGGVDGQRMPIGLQFIGNDFREDLVLRAAYGFEQATQDASWRKLKPLVLEALEAKR
jgi:aspartyl-tRNA(Asn)/glutamyl-tRNA(Gln) amidotransferase subunit A